MRSMCPYHTCHCTPSNSCVPWQISTVELSFLLEIMGPQQIGTRLSLLFSDFCVIQDWFGPMSSLQPRVRGHSLCSCSVVLIVLSFE